MNSLEYRLEFEVVSNIFPFKDYYSLFCDFCLENNLCNS